MGCLVAAGVALWLLLFSPRLALWLVAIGVPTLFLVNRFPNRALREKVDDKCRHLREQAFDALEAMVGAESDQAEYASIGSRDAVIAVAVEHENLSCDTLRIVVRGETDVLFYTLVRFGGFHKSRSGATWPMQDAEFDALD